MCTAVIEVPHDPARPTRLLAVRDEDPNRPWDPPGAWWPDTHPGVVGVRDRLANGAWLAAAPDRGVLAVLLNRAGDAEPDPATPLLSRGSLVLAAARGEAVRERPGTANFNLVEIHGVRATVTSWDGARLVRTALSPGVHMIAHHELDDSATARIARWLPEFRALGGLPDDRWRGEWSALLARTAELHPDDDRAIIRDNRVHGYPTQSLLVCTAEVRGGGVDLESTVPPAVPSHVGEL